MKKMYCLLLCLVLVGSFALSGSSATAEDSLLCETTEVAAISPYVAVYLKEIEEEVTRQSFASPDKNTVDQYVVRVLDDYYKKDVSLIEHLQKYTNDEELFLQILSPDRIEKIKSMHSLAEIYTTDITSECRSLILKYFWRYAIGSEDADAITFLNSNICTANTSPSTYMDYTEQQQGSAALSVTGAEYSTRTLSLQMLLIGPIKTGILSMNTSLRDPNFPYFPGGNCTNFVSALYHGGMLMHEEWYCYKKAGVGTLTVDQQAIGENEFDQIDLYWDIDPSPWISAYEFSEFWFDKCEDVFNTDKAGYLRNQETIFANSIYPGDVVILYNFNAAWIPIPSHVMIITQRDYTNKDFLLAGNTRDRQIHPLATAITTFDAVVFFCL